MTTVSPLVNWLSYGRVFQAMTEWIGNGMVMSDFGEVPVNINKSLCNLWSTKPDRHFLYHAWISFSGDSPQSF